MPEGVSGDYTPDPADSVLRGGEGSRAWDLTLRVLESEEGGGGGEKSGVGWGVEIKEGDGGRGLQRNRSESVGASLEEGSREGARELGVERGRRSEGGRGWGPRGGGRLPDRFLTGFPEQQQQQQQRRQERQRRRRSRRREGCGPGHGGAPGGTGPGRGPAGHSVSADRWAVEQVPEGLRLPAASRPLYSRGSLLSGPGSPRSAPPAPGFSPAARTR